MSGVGSNYSAAPVGKGAAGPGTPFLFSSLEAPMADLALDRPVAPARAGASAWSRLRAHRGWLGFWFMLPAAAILILFLAYPLGLGIWLSFTDARIGRTGQFVGTENYEWLWGDSILWLSVFNTLLYTSVASVIKFAVGLYLAVLLNNNLPFKAIIRSVVLIPADLESQKVIMTAVYGGTLVTVDGSYDDVNRLASELAGEHEDWAFVNVNVRPYYAEGSKTLGFEDVSVSSSR